MGLGLPGMGRFSEPALLILISLAAGERHGYAIMDDVEQLVGVRLGPGTLYGAIARLEGHGLIEAVPSADRRRPYRLSAEGASELRTQLAGLRGLATLGLDRMVGS